MARLNNIVKLVVWQINIVVGLCGFLLFLISMYALFGDWGNLSRSFFLGLGLILMFISLIVSEISSFGALGIEFQNLRTGVWTGKRILSIYLLCNVAAFLSLAFMLYFTTDQVTSLKFTRAELLDGVDVAYDGFEDFISLKFNEFFFGVSAECGSLTVIWFWTFVDNFCPEAMSQANCLRCGDYWVSNCYVDETTCYATYDVVNGGSGTPGENPTCPYEACRMGMLDYFIKRVGFFTWGLLALMLVFFILVLLATMLLCFSKKDSVEDMLVKAGAITRKTRRSTTQPPPEAQSMLSPNGRPRTPGRFSVIQAAKTPRQSVTSPGTSPENALSPTAAAVMQATQQQIRRTSQAASSGKTPTGSAAAKAQNLRSPAGTGAKAQAKGGQTPASVQAKPASSSGRGGKATTRAFFPESKV